MAKIDIHEYYFSENVSDNSIRKEIIELFRSQSKLIHNDDKLKVTVFCNMCRKFFHLNNMEIVYEELKKMENEQLLVLNSNCIQLTEKGKKNIFG